MDKERMAELEKIEVHGAENGWVAESESYLQKANA